MDHLPSRYNLRQRKKVDYNVNAIRNAGWLPYFLGIFLVLGRSSPTAFGNDTTRAVRCIPGGVELSSMEQVPYEICADNHCQTYPQPRQTEIVKFPTQMILHEHQVHWKFGGVSPGTIETVCPAAPFCEHLDCTLCSAVVFNPECWPVRALIATTLFIYFLITGCYVFLYVPLIIGTPIRIAAKCLWNFVRYILRGFFSRIWFHRKKRARISTDLVELLAVSLVILWAPYTKGCQQVNILSHTSTICTKSDQGNVCQVHLSEIFKLSPFKQEACFKLLRGEVPIHEFRRKTRSYVAFMRPNVPTTWNSFALSLSSVTVPPLPTLSTSFISDGRATALWNDRMTPALRCDNMWDAASLRCEVADNCNCYPAENTANCQCNDVNISSWMRDIRHRLPIVSPSLTFQRNKEGQIQANVPSMTTAEIVFTMRDNLTTNVAYGHFRMNLNITDSDLGCLITYLSGNNQTASGFENDLSLTLEALHRQVDVAATLRVDWNHCREDEHFVLGGAGEQVLRILRLLRAAEQVSEKNFETRDEDQVVIGRLNSIHRHAWLDRRHAFEVDSRKVLEFAHEGIRALNKFSDELEKELRRAENQYDNVRAMETQHTFQRHKLLQVLRNDMAAEIKESTKELVGLQEKMKKQDAEMVRLRQTVQSMKAHSETMDPSELVVTVDASKKTKRTVRSESGPVNDEEYFERMINEVQEEGEEQAMEIQPVEQVPKQVEQPDEKQRIREEEPTVEQRRRRRPESLEDRRQVCRPRPAEDHQQDHRLVDHQQVRRPVRSQSRRQVRHPVRFEERHRVRRAASFEERINELRYRARDLEQVLRNFPFRNIGHKKGYDGTCAFCGRYGVHFSDSCPEVVEGDQRLQIVDRKKLCHQCLGSCLPRRCKYNPRSCWYCDRIRGSCVEDLIPEDEGHHKALCPVPDLRAEVRDRLNRMQDDIRDAERRRQRR
ncbi:hypothetical protein OSTOST_03223, partial [Ostertagia ostertagi]